tara:strand:- start:83 stop:352 length:270 start_codon:yes stop_codon:yes gene_type:complete
MKTECELSDSLNDFSDRLCELDLYHDEIVEDADLRGRITHTLTDMTSNLLVFRLLVNSGELYLTDDEDQTLKDMTQWVAETTEYYQSIA